MREYHEVNSCDNVQPVIMNTWKPFFKQFLVGSAMWTYPFMCGLSVGSPTVFIPQIRKEANSTEAITIEMASWMSSAFSFSGLLFSVILSMLMRHFGRKPTCIFICINSFLAFLTLFCSKSNPVIIFSLAMSGVLSAAQTIVSIVVLNEYISPRYRGIYLTAKCATFYWGIWAANAIGTFFHLKKIALVGLICSLYPLASCVFWTESPYWLASNGRFKDCSKSHRWLKGSDFESERELHVLIKTQEKRRETKRRQKLTALERIKKVYRAIICREFYKPTLISLAVLLINILSGKLIFAVYALDIMKKITEEESKAYAGMLILDGITIISMYVGCGVSKFVKRRTMLFVTSLFSVSLSFLIALYLYLITLSVITENTYVTLGLFLCYSIASSVGPLIIPVCIYGELIPLKSRHLVTCLVAILVKLILGVALKVTLIAIKLLGLHGIYMAYGAISLFFVIISYIYVPETKDRTLQEISDSMLCPQKKSSREPNDADESVNLK